MNIFFRQSIIIIALFVTELMFAQEQNYDNTGLTKEEIIYLKENPKIKSLIDDYLQGKTELSKEDSIFIKDAVSLLTESKYKIPTYTEDNYPGKEDGLPFEWWKEPEKYISFEDIEED